jgi:octaprenyl-diphosphate synthase
VESVLQLIASDLSKLEKAIEAMVTTRVPFIKQLVNHIIGSGGKRVRPILVILSARLSGYKGEGHIPYAAIIEFIHTSTLLHDDVVDNAPTRRGSLTANTIWGNEASVLVGDFLFSKSFDLMVDGGNRHILSVMSKTTTALAEGEILELIKTSDMETTEEDYYEIIRDKTAVLFAAACEIGAILGKAPAGKRKRLGEFGHHLGMAFQLMDDILDYTSQDKVLGKHVGTDLEEGKVTLPLIHALRFASPGERSSIKRVLNKKRPAPQDLTMVSSLINRYGGIEYTIDKAGEHTVVAKKLLASLPESPYREALIKLTDFMLKRRT